MWRDSRWGTSVVRSWEPWSWLLHCSEQIWWRRAMWVFDSRRGRVFGVLLLWKCFSSLCTDSLIVAGGGRPLRPIKCCRVDWMLKRKQISCFVCSLFVGGDYGDSCCGRKTDLKVANSLVKVQNPEQLLGFWCNRCTLLYKNTSEILLNYTFIRLSFVYKLEAHRKTVQ